MDAKKGRKSFPILLSTLFVVGISFYLVTKTNHPSESQGTATINHEFEPNNVTQLNTKLRKRISQLEKQLNTERELRKQLEEQLDSSLENNRSTIAAPSETPVAIANNSNKAPDGLTEHNHAASENLSSEYLIPAIPPSRISDENTLAELGLDANTISAFETRVDSIAKERTRLLKEATQTRSKHSPNYAQSLTDLDDQAQSLKKEMSEDEYDRNLYAAGRPNRLVITAVTPNSPAQNAGLAVGDIFVMYDGVRVFDWLDLRLAEQPEVPRIVAIELQRNENTYQTMVPPGPLGIQTNPAMISPN